MGRLQRVPSHECPHLQWDPHVPTAALQSSTDAKGAAPSAACLSFPTQQPPWAHTGQAAPCHKATTAELRLLSNAAPQNLCLPH